MRQARVEWLEQRLFLAAQVVVLGNSTEITSGGTDTSESNYTDFGYNSSSVSTYTVQRGFTLENTGDEDFTLASSNPVTLAGADDDNTNSFSVSSQPTLTTISAESGSTITSTTFTISFVPSSAGTKTATVTILSSDGSTLFTFAISGTAISTTAQDTTLDDGTTATLQYATITEGSGTTAANGDIVDITYAGYLLTGLNFDRTSSHSGTPYEFKLGAGSVIKGWDLGMAGMLPGEKRVLIFPSTLGYGSSGSGSIPADANLIFVVELVGYGPNLYVEGNSTYITSGDWTPTSTDYTDFGTTPYGLNVTRTFDLVWQMDSTAYPYTVSSVTLDTTTTNASEFAVDSFSNTQAVIVFTPTADATDAASTTVTISYTYNGETRTYTFAISGSLAGEGVQLTDGTLSFEGTDSVDDVVTLTYDSSTSTYTLTCNGTTATYDTSSETVSRIMFSGLGGNDSLVLNSTVTLPASLSGGNGNDTLEGGAGNDSISGGDGNDSIMGGDGDDTISGGLGADLLSGGAGTDTLSYDDAGRTKAVKVTLDGRSGDGSSQDGVGGTGRKANVPADAIMTDIENLIGTEFADTLVGNADANDIQGLGGNDLIAGNAGADTLDGGAGNDTISGGADADSITGGDGNDSIVGGAGANTLGGGAGNDILKGGADADSILGGDGNDRLYGGASSDTLAGGLGSDSIYGGSGVDYADYSSDTDRTVGVSVTFNGKTDDGSADDSTSGSTRRDYVNKDVEGVYGTDFADTIVGNGRWEVFYGKGGNDSIVGNGGNDAIDGGDGDDTLLGGAGNDFIYAADGDDSVDGGSGSDFLWGDMGNDIIHGATGNDTVEGGIGDDTLYGDAGHDSMVGGDGDNYYYARDGALDTIEGGGGGTDHAQIDQAPIADTLTGSNIELLA